MIASAGASLVTRLFHLTATTTITASALAGSVIEAVAGKVGHGDPSQAQVARAFQRLSTSEPSELLSIQP